MGAWKMIFGSEILRDRGFTIVEVLIAMMIFSIALLALVSLATTSMKATEMGRRMTQGNNLATQKMESLKAVPFKHLNRDGTYGSINKDCTVDAVDVNLFECIPDADTESLDDMTFTWYWNVTYVDLNGNNETYADPTVTGDPNIDDGDMRLVTVVIEWSDIMGNHNTTLSMLRSVL